MPKNNAHRDARRLGFEILERRTLLTGWSNEITALYNNGFNPTSLQLNGNALLEGTKLRLTDGGPGENSSAYSTIPVDVIDGFTTTFQFQITPNMVSSGGQGFAFNIQDELGPSELGATNPNPSFPMNLGLISGSYTEYDHIAVTVDSYARIDANIGGSFTYNNSGLYRLTPGSNAAQIVVPETSLKFLSGHVMQMTIAYTPPSGTIAGNVVETIEDTNTHASFTQLYDNIDITNSFKIVDSSGKYAYVGFSATSGDSARSDPQDILNWTWRGGDPTQSATYTAKLTLAKPQTTSGAIYDSVGHLVRTLWQANPLDAGTYNLYWDGLDQNQRAVDPSINPGPYSFQVVESNINYTVNMIGNDTSQPSNPSASFSSLGMNGVAVSPDGAHLWIGELAGDTAGGASIVQLDGNGNIDASATQNMTFPGFVGGNVAFDSNYIYVTEPVFGGGGPNGLGGIIVKYNRLTGEYGTGFTDYGHINSDGTINNNYGWIHYLQVTTLTTGIMGIAVTNYDDPDHGMIWVADSENNLLHRFDKVTGDQIGIPIAIEGPTGVALDASGNLWVAHRSAGSVEADLISVYSPTGLLIRDVTEAVNLQNISSLAIAGGKLYLADRGAGQVLVYSISGTSLSDGVNPMRVGGPATYGHDDGRNYFWNLTGVAADAEGDIFTVQDLPEVTPTRTSGAQVEKWSSTGVPLWVKGGYEYQSNAGAYSADDPTILYSSSLQRFLLDTSNGDWVYDGSVIYPGYNSNPWSNVPSAAPAKPPKFVSLGGTDFFVLSMGNRVIFYRTSPTGDLHPAAIVGTSGGPDGGAWTWDDTLGDGIPQSDQIKGSTGPGAGGMGLTVDPQGNLWYTLGTTLYKMTFAGSDTSGNPVYDWSRSARIVTLASPFFVISDQSIFEEFVDPDIGPESSSSVDAGFSIGGANALSRFDLNGNLVWTIPLPAYSQSLDYIPGGGVIVGAMVGVTLYYVTEAGQVLGPMNPPSDGDWLDFAGGAISVGRNSQSGYLDVFTEDIGWSSNDWFRIDDHSLNNIMEGRALLGGSVELSTAPQAPQLPHLNISDGSSYGTSMIANSPRPTLTGNAEPGAYVELMTSSQTVLGSTIADSLGSYSISPSTPLPNGVFDLEIQYVDTSGNVSPASAVFTLTIAAAPDAPALVAADDSGVAGDGITSSSRPRLAGDAEDGARVRLYIAGEIVGSGTAIGGAYTILLVSPLADGTYFVTSKVVDEAGNESPASIPFSLTIDTTAPAAPTTPTLQAAENSGTVGESLTSTNRPLLTGTAESGSTVRLYIAGIVVGSGVATGGAFAIRLNTALADGTYGITATATDAAGNVSASSSSLSLTIDATPPAAPSAPALLASDDSGVAGDRITNVDTPHFQGTAEAGSTVRLSIGATLIGMATATGGTYTILSTVTLADGTYAVTATATDAAGNVSAVGAAFTLTVDTIAPAAPSPPSLLASDDSGVAGDGITSATRPRLTGAAEAGSIVRLFIDGTVVGTAAATGGLYVIPIASPLANGTYSVTAMATDAAGNVGPAGLAFRLTIDTTPPSAPPAPGLLAADDSGTVGGGVTNVSRPRLSGPAEPGSTVRLFIAGGLVGTGTATGGVYTIQLASALGDGTYAVTATATDAAGNTSAAGPAFALTIDATPPAAPAAPSLPAADDSGAVGDGITDVSRPRLTGTAVAGSTVRLLIGGSVVGTATATGGSYTILLAAGLADGTYSVTASATDAAGNTSAAGPAFALTIDTRAPAAPPSPGLLAADDSGAVGDGITNVNEPRLTGTAEAGATVRLFVAGALAGTATASGGSYTIPLASALGDGTYAVTVTATDAAGNTSAVAAAFALTIDATPPAAPAAPSLLAADDSGAVGDGVTNVGRPRLTGSAEAGSTVSLSIAGSVVGTGTAAGGTYTIPLATALAAGTYRVTATATDAAGNASAAGAAFVLTIATAAPAAPSLALATADDSGVKGDGVTDVHRPRVTGTAAAGSLVQLLDARGDVVGGATASGPGGSYTIFTPTALVGTVTYRVRAVDSAGNAGPASAPLTFRVQAVAGDYDGDGKADVITYDAADALWSIRLSSTGANQKVSFGAPDAVPVVADYDGDGRADLAVYVPSTGQWLIRNSSNGSVTQYAFGGRGDIPVPADYNAIGRAEPALYRPSTAQWIVYDPADGRGYVWTFGFPGKSLPVPGEFAGYGAVDLAVYEPGSGDWYSVNTTTWALVHASFGLPGDVPAASDYDGDGRTDVAVYRPSTAAWYISQSSTGATRAAVYGSPNVDQPVPLDYDGDGQSDLAIYLASGSGFALLSSQSGASQFPIVGRAGVDIAAQMTWSYLYANVIRMATIRTSAKPALAIGPASTTTATSSRPADPPPPRPSPAPAVPAVIKGSVVPQGVKKWQWTW